MGSGSLETLYITVGCGYRDIGIVIDISQNITHTHGQL